MNNKLAVVISIFFGLAPLLAGCGKGTSLDRLPVHGTIKLPEGDKKLNGLISFQPSVGQSGPVANTKVTEGSYNFDRSNGPTAGPKEVKFKRIISRGESLQALTKRKPNAAPKLEWTRSADVSDDGKYVLDFELDD